MSKQEYEGFSLSLALFDALPVLLFGVSCVLLGMLFGSRLFVAGAVLCFSAGFMKVLWKIILALREKDVSILNRLFRYLMCAGFAIIILSVVLGAERISFPKVWSGISSFPSAMFFILWACGMAAMGVLGKKLDSSMARSNWIEQSVNCAAQLCLLLALLFLL